MNSIIQAESIEYWVEVSKQPAAKSGYTRRLTTQSRNMAQMYYNMLNIGRGYKKRLRAFSPSLNHVKLIERSFS